MKAFKFTSEITSIINGKAKSRFAVIIFAVLLTIFLASYFYYSSQKERIKKAQIAQLQAISKFKTEQVSDWLNDNVYYLRDIYDSHMLSTLLYQWLNNRTNNKIAESIVSLLRPTYKKSNYSSIIIFDKNKKIIFHSTNDSISIDKKENEFLDEVISSKKPLFTGFYESPSTHQVRLSYYIPVFKNHDKQTDLIGVTSVEINPLVSLFPLIQSWPVASISGEALIIRQDLDSVVFLTNLRFHKDAPLKLRFPLNRIDLPAAMAARGQEGVAEGTDYRNVHVLAVIKRIPNSNWYLIDKIDTVEAYTDVKTIGYLILLITVFLFSLIIIGFNFFAGKLSKEFSTQFESLKEERELIVKHYEDFIKNANDMILLMTEKGEIIEVNERACVEFQYTKDELVGMDIRSLKPDQTHLDVPKLQKKINTENGHIFDTYYLRKDKTEFPAEVSSRSITISEKRYFQSIIRNITDRKKDEDRIKKLNNTLKLISTVNRTIVHAADENKLIDKICQIITYKAGFINAWIGMVQKDGDKTILPINSSVKNTTHLKAIRYSYSTGLEGHTPVGDAVKTGMIQISNDNKVIYFIREWHDAVLKSGFRSTISLPLKEGEEVFGVLTINSRHVDSFIDTDVVELLEELTNDLAYGITSIRNSLEKQVAQKELIESQEKYRKFFEEDLTGDYITTPDGTLKLCNPAFLETLGYKSDDELLNTNIYELYENPLQRHSLVQRIENEKRVERIESQLIKKDRERITVLENVVGHFDEDGKLFEITGYIFDITDIKNAQNKLKLSEKKYRNLFENANDAIIVIEPETRIVVEVNQKACEMYEYSHDEFVGRNFIAMSCSPDSCITKLSGLLENKSNVTCRIQYKTKSNRIIDVAINASLIDYEGKTRVLSIIRDITQELKANEKMNLMAHALESVSEYVSITDLDNKILFVNNAFCKAYGYTMEEILGMNMISIVRSGNNNTEQIKNIFPTTMKGGWSGEMINKRKDGSEFPVYLTTAPIKNENGDIFAAVGVALDITDRKKTIEELTDAKEKAQQSERMKSEFLAQMSHEIRTPLNAVLSYATLIKDDLKEYINDDLSTSFQGMDNAGKRIVRTIDSILNMSELQTGKYQVENKKINIKERILRDIYSEFSLSAKNKGLEFSISAKANNTNIFCDEYSIYQIFGNLVDNAIKYTKKGKVYIEVRRNSADKLEVEVTDTGIGISEAYLPELFTAFSQEEQGYSRKFEGNGLGLALVHRYCELNNISIKVKSKKNVGTTFTLTFN